MRTGNVLCPFSFIGLNADEMSRGENQREKPGGSLMTFSHTLSSKGSFDTPDT
jgi:hypothetical protein